MAESTLSFTYTTLLREVGHFLGFGYDTSSYSSNQTSDADFIVQSGYRQFLFPPVLDGKVHIWSFLSPAAEIDVFASIDDWAASTAYVVGDWVVPTTANTYIYQCTTAGTSHTAEPSWTTTEDDTTTESTGVVWTCHALDYLTSCDDYDTIFNFNLPDDFGGAVGNFTFSEAGLYWPVPVVGEGQIRSLRSQSDYTGKPKYVAIRPLANDGSTGQRFELMVWPNLSGSYTLHYKYNVLTSQLTTGAPYPLGGMQHTETILQSCLAVAERRRDDQKGIQWDMFVERLGASIAYDRQIMTPAFLGYNADGSDETQTWYRTENVTYNNVLYGSS